MPQAQAQSAGAEHAEWRLGAELSVTLAHASNGASAGTSSASGIVLKQSAGAVAATAVSSSDRDGPSSSGSIDGGHNPAEASLFPDILQRVADSGSAAE